MHKYSQREFDEIAKTMGISTLLIDHGDLIGPHVRKTLNFSNWKSIFILSDTKSDIHKEALNRMLKLAQTSEEKIIIYGYSSSGSEEELISLDKLSSIDLEEWKFFASEKFSTGDKKSNEKIKLLAAQKIIEKM